MNQAPDVLAAGKFSLSRMTQPARGLARLVGPTGTLDTILTPSTGPNGCDQAVSALSIDSNDIHIGGEFLTYRGEIAPYYVIIDRVTGTRR